MEEKNPAAVALGKRSAEVRKKLGHDSEYYRKLAVKSHAAQRKAKKKRISTG